MVCIGDYMEDLNITLRFLDKVYTDLSNQMSLVSRDDFEILLDQRKTIKQTILLLEELYDIQK